jgi:hypothetical protein
MSETSAANQSEKVAKVRRQPKPKALLSKSFASSRAGVNGLLSRSREPSLQQEQGASLFNRPAMASHSAPAHDFSQVSALTAGSATAMFRAVPSSTPAAFAGGRGATAFLAQQEAERNSVPSGATTEEVAPVQTQRGGREISSDHTQTLRRADEEPAPAPAAPKLTKTNLRGPTPSPQGAYNWVIQWQLSDVSPAGGWIVQRVNMDGDIADGDDNPIATRWDPFVPYWEAWKVNAGQSITVFADGTEASDAEDDTFANRGYGPNTKGQTEQTGSAEFYEGLTLPGAFQVIPGHPAGILLTTTSDPGLSGGSGAIPHNLAAKWDGVDGDGSTELVSD